MTTLEKRVKNIIFDSNDPRFKNINYETREKICRDFLYIAICLHLDELSELEKYSNVISLTDYRLRHIKHNESYVSIMTNCLFS